MKSLALYLASFAFASTTYAADPVWLQDLTAAAITDADTPDFTARQNYLEAAPVGVGAKDAWKLAGGRGDQVKIIDIETGHQNSHEDLGSMFYMGNNPEVSDHGTAVLGILRGTLNPMGVTGISYESELGFYGFIEGNQDEVDEKYITGINAAIRSSADRLQAGDVLVIEQHMVGPDRGNYTAVELWDEIFAELKKATDKGILCVEAAGNGGSNFDAPAYKGAFDLKIRDSGCIMVGAGAVGSHDRLYFSNYGSRIDAHGYGGEVTTTGYGDLFNGGAKRLYTRRFSGTSSATPIVAGAVALVSSIAKAQGRVITPLEMREALRMTGTPQGKATLDKRIGNMPNIDQMLTYLKLKK